MDKALLGLLKLSLDLYNSRDNTADILVNWVGLKVIIRRAAVKIAGKPAI